MAAARGEVPVQEQVRRCASCGAPSAVLVEARGASAARWIAGEGAPAPAAIRRGTFRCQSCGADLRWRRHHLGAAVLGVALGFGALLTGLGAALMLVSAAFGSARSDALLGLACLLPPCAAMLGAVYVLWRRWTAERRWPPVDAPRPALARPYRAGTPSARRCACGASAPVVRVVQERLKHILPIGKVREHSCAACGRTFNVHDRWAVAFASLAASILSAAGAFVVLVPPGSSRWIGYVLLALGVGAWSVPIARVAARARHPIVGPTQF